MEVVRDGTAEQGDDLDDLEPIFRVREVVSPRCAETQRIDENDPQDGAAKRKAQDFTGDWVVSDLLDLSTDNPISEVSHGIKLWSKAQIVRETRLVTLYLQNQTGSTVNDRKQFAFCNSNEILPVDRSAEIDRRRAKEVEEPIRFVLGLVDLSESDNPKGSRLAVQSRGTRLSFAFGVMTDVYTSQRQEHWLKGLVMGLSS